MLPNSLYTRGISTHLREPLFDDRPQARILPVEPAATVEEQLDAAKRIDRLGYTHIWTWAHIMRSRRPISADLRGMVLRSCLGHGYRSRRVSALLVGANTFRNPGLVAKRRPTLDHVSAAGHPRDRWGVDWSSSTRLTGSTSGAGSASGGLARRVGGACGSARRRSVTSEPGGHYHFDDLRHQPLPSRSACRS